MAVFLIDFDGTCVAKTPGSGYSDFDTGAERVLKKLVENGHQLVLWTCRNNSPNNPYNYIRGKYKRPETSLEEAIRWFQERDIFLSGINHVPGEIELVGNSRKALGDFIIDDTAIGAPLKKIKIDWTDYETGILHKNVLSFCIDWDNIERLLEIRGLLCNSANIL